MLVLSSSLLASATHPSSLEALAVQHFGRANAAPFLEMNRHLQDSSGSGNDGDISSVCDNEQFVQFCAATDEQLEQYIAMSANDGATSGEQRFLTTAGGGVNLCTLKAMKGFYCDTLCSTSCKSFLAKGGDGENFASSSSNDESTGGEGNDAPPSFLTNESELNKMCSSSCLIDLLKSMAGMIGSLASCGEAELSQLSSNDGAAPGAGGGASEGMSDPTAQIEQQLGTLCVKNDKNQYCMAEFAAFGEKHPDKPADISCDTEAVKELVGLGCCFGSVVAMSALAPEGQSPDDKQDIDDMIYWVNKCGGTVLPCASGALKDVTLVSSSLSLSTDDSLTIADLEKPVVINAIKKNIAASIKKPATSIIIEEITTTSSRVRGRRSLEASTVDIKYAVMVESSEAAAVQASIKSIDDTSLTTAFTNDVAFNDVIPNVSAQQSKTVTTEVSTASPGGVDGGNAGNAAAPAFTAVLMAAVLAGALVL